MGFKYLTRAMAYGAMSLISEFKDFITKGDVVALAVAVVIGVAFNAVVTAFVSDLITPLIGVAGHYNFAALTYTLNGSTFEIGLFVNELISFIVIALVVFFLLVRPIEKIKARQDAKKPKAAPDTKTCPYCFTSIPVKATRCPNCTSRLSK